MLRNDYYYNGNIKKIIALFGSLFNDIKIAKYQNGDTQALQRVPLAYAPKERYLTRLHVTNPEDEGSDVAIKLPRMAFEISSFEPDTESKLNRLQRTLQTDPKTGKRHKVWQSVAYKINIDLNVMSRGHDEALQIVEQIIPFFNPSYTVTVKGLEGPDSKTDIPIVMNSLSFEDSYEGDYEASRRLIIYTLSYSLPVKFSLPIDLNEGGIIKRRTNKSTYV